ncbi:laccase domain-containing protein, partial [Klebsiella pneumoniae]
VHSASVIDWQAGQQTNTIPADGVFTDEHQPIAVITADCLPILIAAKNGEKVAAVHGGWKGLQGGIIANAVQRFADAGIAVD